MMDLNDFTDAIKDFFQEKRTLALIISLLAFFLLVAMIIVCIQNPGLPSKSKKTSEKALNTIILDNEVLPPAKVELLKDYYPVREKKEKWSEKDAEKYISLPDDSLVNVLETANNTLVQEIVDSAP